MLIRIDVYPNNEENKSVVPTSTLYASLATTRRESDKQNKGCLIHVGRKNGDVTFVSDKSVSRQHCLLRLIGNPQQLQPSGGGGENDTTEDDHHGSSSSSSLLEAPRTAEETQACQDNPLNMCIVLENLGKGGSYIAVATEPPPILIPDDDSATDHGGGDSDSETDEEGISQPSKSQKNVSQRSQSSHKTGGDGTTVSQSPGQGDIPPLSTATSHYWKKTTTKKRIELIPVQAGESHILSFPKPLSSIQQQNKRVKEERTIMIQCGRFESTMAITWLDYQWAFSRLLKKQMTELTRDVPLLLGGQLVPDHLPTSTTTHLITPQLLGGAKQLISWCYQIPMVVPGFCNAMMSRNQPNDPFPLVSDYMAETPSSSGKQEPSFWTDVTPNPQLLASYTLLSVESNDMERLAESAGVQILRLYEMETEDEALEEAQDLVSQGQDCIAITGTSPNNRSSLSKKLASIDQIHMVSPKDLAKAISEQDSTKLVRSGGGGGSDKRMSSKSQSSSSSVSFAKSQSQHEFAKSQSQHDDIEGESCEAAVMGSCNSAFSQVLLDHPPPAGRTMDVVQELEDEEEENVDDEAKDTTSHKKKSIKASPLSSTNRSIPSTTHGSKLLGASNADGWFAIAPKQEELRKNWRERALKKEAHEQKDFVILPPAETGHVVVYAPTSAAMGREGRTGSQSYAQRRRPEASSYYYSSLHPSSVEATAGKKNFKRFRKNSVAYHPDTARLRIVLRPVSPQHDQIDEPQQAFENQRHELEEQQKIADEFFRGDGLQSTMKKRRRL